MSSHIHIDSNLPRRTLVTSPEAELYTHPTTVWRNVHASPMTLWTSQINNTTLTHRDIGGWVSSECSAPVPPGVWSIRLHWHTQTPTHCQHTDMPALCFYRSVDELAFHISSLNDNWQFQLAHRVVVCCHTMLWPAVTKVVELTRAWSLSDHPCCSEPLISFSLTEQSSHSRNMSSWLNVCVRLNPRL